jgi:YD repeat-containing protein
LGGNTGLTTSGGPITTSGNIILAGVLNIENGGTGANTAAKAITSLLPNQTNNAGKFLKTTGTGLQWETVSGGTSSNTSNSEPSDATYSYDDQSRIISVTETIDGSQKVSSYSYNSNNTVSTATIVFQGVTRIETYGYDSNGLVTSMTATYL